MVLSPLTTQGNFTDLCRGPHLVDTGEIKAIKLTSVAGAFWRGDANREQMQRLYGISFPKEEDARRVPCDAGRGLSATTAR